MLAAGLSINDNLLGLGLLLAAFAVGAYPLFKWKYRSTQDPRLSVASFPDELASVMSKASTINRRLHVLAQQAKPGPVQDHLLVLAATANLEVKNAYTQFEAATDSHIFVELMVERSSLVEDLTELEHAATSLLKSQHDLSDIETHEPAPQLSTSLAALAEQTHEIQRQLTAIASPKPNID